MKKWSLDVTSRENWWSDVLASVVVFLMALPLCMGIAIASGAPVEAGLITGIIGGILVGTISGSQLQVSGPAAGLSMLVFEVIQNYGFKALAIIVLCAGIIQILMGRLKLGRMFRAVSPAVINGMLTGIGILLILSQLFVMSDLSPKGSGWQNLMSIPHLASCIVGAGSHHVAAIIGLFTLLCLLAWTKLAPSSWRSIPSPLIAVIAGTLLACLISAKVKHVTVPDNLLSAVNLVQLSSFSQLSPLEILRCSLALALIASAETLMSAAAVDKLHQGKRTNYDKELTAQGIGNVLCGLLGGLPMTGVIARSSINVYAGAKTRLSAILHGLWLLLAIIMLPMLLRCIPLASLSALLMYTGFKLIDVKSIRKLWNYGKRLVAIYAITVVMIVTTDLLMGVLTGIVLSIIKLLYTMSRMHISIDRRERCTILHLKGAATFISLPSLANAMESVPNNTELHVCLDELDYVDHACLELLLDWEKQHAAAGGKLVIDWGELNAMFRHKRRPHSLRRSRHMSAIPCTEPLIPQMIGEVS
ncbi:MAG TPA: SulP family inorganic anion transporter [Candidatus Obscuribacterales bacterium]